MTEREKKVKIHILRSDPEMGKGQKWQSYSVPSSGSILDALRYVYEQEDSTLAFRFGCSGPGYERCGACAVIVDGVPTLSCRHLVHEGARIEPHPKFEILRDLVVDFDRERDRTRQIEQQAHVKITVNPDRCDGCRDCVSVCPVKVFDVQKIGGKGKAVPVDIESCCGLACMQCAIFCRNNAITIEERKALGDGHE